jgi:hypothetical protein
MLLRCTDGGGRTDNRCPLGSAVLGLYDGGASDSASGDTGEFLMCTLPGSSSWMDADDCRLCWDF